MKPDERGHPFHPASGHTQGGKPPGHELRSELGVTVHIPLPFERGLLAHIVQERRLEFVGEGKRYWDLVRTGKAAATLVPDQYNYRTNAWSESKKYLPIPQSEMDAAQGTLTQNDY